MVATVNDHVKVIVVDIVETIRVFRTLVFSTFGTLWAPYTFAAGTWRILLLRRRNFFCFSTHQTPRLIAINFCSFKLFFLFDVLVERAHRLKTKDRISHDAQ